MLFAATVIPLSIRRDWWVRAFDFPRVQIACLCIGWLLLMKFSSAPLTPGLTFCSVVVFLLLVYQCYWIYPNTSMHPVEVETYSSFSFPAAPVVKILSCNVLMTNRHAQPLMNQIIRHQPDIFIALESDQWWQDQLDTLDGYAYRIACPLDNLYGMHVYSRLELINPLIEFRVEADKPSMSMSVKATDKISFQLYVVHPAPPAPGENDQSTERDVELITLAKSLKKSLASDNIPTIVAGDINDVAWSATTRLFRQISGLLDPRIGRGLFNTFNAHYRSVRWPLDHVFVSSHFQLVNLLRLPAMGSDHFPLLAELAIVPDTRVDNFVENLTLDTERLDDILDTTAAHQADQPGHVK